MRSLKPMLLLLVLPVLVGMVWRGEAAASSTGRNPDRSMSGIVLPVQAREDEYGDSERSSDPESSSNQAWLGIHLQNLDESLREAFDVRSGALVSDVVSGSPADRAGIQKGDIIVRIDDRAVRTPSDVVRRIRAHEPGDRVKITRVRKGRESKVEVKLTAAPERLGRRDGNEPSWLNGSYLGARVEELNGDLAPYFDVDPESGVLVVAVEDDSPASRAGLKPGDVITQVDGERVHSSAELIRAIQEKKPETKVTLTTIRRGQERRVEATLAQAPPWDRLRHLTRGDFDPMMQGLRERMREGRDAMAERMERLEEMIRDLERRVEDLSKDRK